MVAVCKDHADLKIARVIPRAGQRRDFPRGGRAPAPWAKIPATTGRENQSSPPCRPDAPCGSRQFQTEHGEIHFAARRRFSDLRKRNFLLRRDSCLKLRSRLPALLVSDAFFCITHHCPARRELQNSHRYVLPGGFVTAGFIGQISARDSMKAAALSGGVINRNLL